MEIQEQQKLLVKEIILKIPIYDFFVKIVITNNLLEYLKSEQFNVKGISEISPATVYYTSDFENYPADSLIVINKKSIRNEVILCHESFHLTHNIMRHSGCKLTDNSEEAYAYLIAYVYKQLRLNLIKLSKEINLEE